MNMVAEFVIISGLNGYSGCLEIGWWVDTVPVSEFFIVLAKNR